MTWHLADKFFWGIVQLVEIRLVGLTDGNMTQKASYLIDYIKVVVMGLYLDFGWRQTR